MGTEKGGFSASKIIDIARGKLPDPVATIRQPPPQENVKLDDVDIRSVMSSARLHGEQEVDKFVEAIRQFRAATDNSVLFSSIGKMIDAALVGEMVEKIIRPLLRGEPVPGIPTDSEAYDDMRADIYQSLINKYVPGGKQ